MNVLYEIPTIIFTGRRWEVEETADSWQLPRSELELGEELGHGFFGTVNRGLWRHQVQGVAKR